MRLLASVTLCLVAMCQAAFGLGQPRYVENSPRPGSFAIVHDGQASPLYVNVSDYAGVVRAAGDLQSDIARVTSVTPTITHPSSGLPTHVVIIGTLGKSPLIDAWSQRQDRRRPDRRQMGIVSDSGCSRSRCRASPARSSSPAATSAARSTASTISPSRSAFRPGTGGPMCRCAAQDALFVKPGVTSQGAPAVKYRGIFLNDEAPALSGWVAGKVRRPQPRVLRRKVFELILRLQGQLSLARDVEQRLQRRRSGESQAGRRIRHRDGHVASRADDAGAAGMEATRQRDRGTTRHNAETLRQVLDGGHRAQQELREHHHRRACAATATCRWREERQHQAARKDRRRPAQDSSPST